MNTSFDQPANSQFLEGKVGVATDALKQSIAALPQHAYRGTEVLAVIPISFHANTNRRTTNSSGPEQRGALYGMPLCDEKLPTYPGKRLDENHYRHLVSEGII